MRRLEVRWARGFRSVKDEHGECETGPVNVGEGIGHGITQGDHPGEGTRPIGAGTKALLQRRVVPFSDEGPTDVPAITRVRLTKLDVEGAHVWRYIAWSKAGALPH